MTIPVEERLVRAAAVLDEQIERHSAGLPYATEAPVHRRHRAVTAAVATAAAIALTLFAVTLPSDRNRGTVAATPPPDRAPGTEGWDLLTPAPIPARFQHVSVSTGNGLLVWGGYGTDGRRTDGAFYDAARATWQELPEAPLARDRGDAVAAWTGTEVVVMNGVEGGVKAAAFDPESFTWRPLPDPPLTNAANMSTRVLVVDGAVIVIAVSVEAEGGARNEVARLDPTGAAWLIGEPPPRSFGSGFDAVVAGQDIVVIGRRGRGGNSCGESVVMAYAPAVNGWRNLPSGPIGMSDGMAVASVGREVLAAGGYVCGEQNSRSEAFLLDPVTASWRPAAGSPTGVESSDRYGEVWTGRWAVASASDGSPALYDPAGDRWHLGSPTPLGTRYTETAWTWVAGRVVVFSGGLASADGRCCDPVDGGYAYTPPNEL